MTRELKLIQTIVDQANDNPKMMDSIMGASIVKEAREVLNATFKPITTGTEQRAKDYGRDYLNSEVKKVCLREIVLLIQSGDKDSTERLTDFIRITAEYSYLMGVYDND